jgi:DHHC palmitoyltransferase
MYLNIVGKVVSGTLYGVFAISTLFFAGFASAIDPADINIYKTHTRLGPRDTVPGHLYCYRCERHVDETSKHCTLCQKCVHNFDHHCIWLNNCVGTHNYKHFIGLLVCAACMLLIQFAISIYIIVFYGMSSSNFNTVVRGVYPGLSGDVFFGLTVLVLVFVVVGLLLVLQLLTFHIFLIYKGYTTYDYIMHRQKANAAPAPAPAPRPASPVREQEERIEAPASPADNREKFESSMRRLNHVAPVHIELPTMRAEVEEEDEEESNDEEEGVEAPAPSKQVEQVTFTEESALEGVMSLGDEAAMRKEEDERAERVKSMRSVPSTDEEKPLPYV